jgi:GDP-4-dehydro-6-deoxy-D-mannose reductase
VDVRDKDALVRALSGNAFDEVVHLAGISFVPDSVADPLGTYEVNFLGTLSLLESLREVGFAGRFLFVSSGDAYGLVDEGQLPVTEATALAPRNPYAVSKAAAEALCYQWSQTSGFEVLVARPFNHIGPGQSERFALSDFARQIALLCRGEAPRVLRVGNVEVTRDFLDARDVVRAYDALLKCGVNANVYNICSSREYSLSDLVGRLIKISGQQITVETDAARWRPAEQRRMLGSNAKLVAATGWAPAFDLDETLTQIYRHWEQQVDA